MSVHTQYVPCTVSSYQLIIFNRLFKVVEIYSSFCRNSPNNNRRHLNSIARMLQQSRQDSRNTDTTPWQQLSLLGLYLVSDLR